MLFIWGLGIGVWGVVGGGGGARPPTPQPPIPNPQFSNLLKNIQIL
jgi:hypothetical protein